ncbi:hypothetical protein HNR40_008865 [Nonomuraea endophytica]|uniref:Uncharacterized protein n=1 Tax=Nonomuraea endophytica TaxID=714136 RepID=A0A7W8AC01_9ACTN|nr:hypothetical protein [Nonomuraea endophytica]
MTKHNIVRLPGNQCTTATRQLVRPYLFAE